MPQNSQKRRKRPLSQVPLEGAKRSRSTGSVDDQEPPTCLRRAGTVNYMILKNFMCHSLLEINLSQNNISMVIGKNGSGKSALLTALIVGLGGKATLTNRGSSVRSFVKAGRPSGSVEIQLNNEGPMAYRPRVYGKTITIIRNLSASGGGSYRIKSAAGEVISTQAKEVVNITSNLNIQVDNPICLLNQDTSRNFLNSSDPKNKFALFMKATKLDVLESEYKTILANKADCQRLLGDKRENFKKLQEEVCRLKVKIDGHQSIVTLKERKLALQNEMMWAQVRDVEEELAEEQRMMDKILKRLEDVQSNNTKKAEEVGMIEESIRNYERQIGELKEQLEIQKRPQNDLKNRLEELQGVHNEAKEKRQRITIEIDVKNKHARYLEGEIANASENISKLEQQKKDRINNLSALQEKLRSMDDQLETARNELFQIKSDISRKEDEEGGLKTEIAQLNQRIDNEGASLEALEKGSGDSLVLYGRNIPRVVEMIRQQRGSFQHEPKGPLGAYIKLKDRNWAVAAEGFLGRNILGAFTVDNQKDGKLLQQIFTRCLDGQPHPNIITSKFIFKKHDVSGNLVQAPGDCRSLYDALIIDDPVVSNCIVDQMNTENVLLIPSAERAMELMSEERLVPPRCKQSVTMEGDRYYPDPNYRTYGSTYHQARYLQVDTQAHVRLLKETIGNLKGKKQAVRSQLEALQRDRHQQAAKQQILENKIRKVTEVKQRIRRQYEDLSGEAEPVVQDLNNLEEELEETRRVAVEKRAALGRTEEEMRDIQAQINDQKEHMSKLRRSSKALEERIWPLQEQIKEAQAKQRQISAAKDLDRQKLNDLERKVANARSAVALKQSEVTVKASNASKLGERPLELRKVPEISSEIQEVTRSIDRIETDTENIEEVSRKHQELLQKCKDIEGFITVLKENLKELNIAVDGRKRHYKVTENYFINFIKHSFRKVLEFRQFKGSIEINTERKELDLVVMPQQGSQGSTSTSNLSGGERSFSTVAFLYSMWQCMDFPFYFLDEFDVFMDKMNRTKVIEILLHHANSKPDLQFVFLTPQDVSFISQNITMFRLEDPRRFNS